MLIFLGYRNLRFAKNKTHVFNNNSLKNVKGYLAKIHKLDKDKDINKLLLTAPPPTQTSGIVNRLYNKVILFCYLKFRKALCK
jgi:hypothetical protein